MMEPQPRKVCAEARRLSRDPEVRAEGEPETTADRGPLERSHNRRRRGEQSKRLLVEPPRLVGRIGRCCEVCASTKVLAVRAQDDRAAGLIGVERFVRV